MKELYRITEWGFVRKNHWDDGEHVETSWTGPDGWTTGKYTETSVRFWANGRQVVKRERIVYAGDVTEWEEVNE